MPNTVSSIKERLYVVPEVTFGTAVAPAGTDCVRFISASIDPAQNMVARPDKLGDEDEAASTPGRRSCTWSASMSMAGSGAAGTAPDCTDLLAATYGKAATVVGGTSVTYALGLLRQSLSLWKYDETGLAQVAFGAVVQQLKILLGGDTPTLEFSGEAVWGYDSAQAADGSTETAAKGGLVSWPAEPSTQTTNGVPPQGFDITATIDGNVFSTLLNATITITTGRQLPKDGMNKYPTAPVTGVRQVAIDFGVKEDDSSIIISLMQKAQRKVPLNASFVVGTSAGNIWTPSLKNILLATPKPDSSQIQRHMMFNGARAYPTGPGALDATQLVVT